MPARAATDADFNSGVQAYNKKDFALAATKIQASIAHGHKNAGSLLYLGHAYFGGGDRAHALQTYSELAKIYPDSNEALLAVQQMRKLDSAAAKKYEAYVMSRSGTASKQDLITRLIVTDPKLGHAKVRPQTIEIVKNAIRQLDPRYSKMLADSGTTITVMPNTLDRWPDGGGDTMFLPASKTTLLAEAGGQTYHRDNGGPDINIFERPIIRGTKQLKEPFRDHFIKYTAFHEMGHGIDDLLNLSKNATYLSLHAQDSAALSAEDRVQYSYFTTPMEACAEITGGLIGHNEADAETAGVNRCFPKVSAWLKQQLRFY